MESRYTEVLTEYQNKMEEVHQIWSQQTLSLSLDVESLAPPQAYMNISLQ